MTTEEDQMAGALAERERIQAIFDLPEAKGREASALKIAVTTNLSADEARGLLASIPKALLQTGRRACDSPIGLVLDTDDRPCASSDVLTPAQVATAANEGRR